MTEVSVNGMPSLSIITATRNDCWMLSKTFKSVHLQTYPLIEHVIQDSISTDETQALVKFWETCSEKRIIYNSEPDNGVYNGMNKAISRCCGDYACFINSGDIFPDFNTVNLVAEQIVQLGHPDVLIGIGKVGNRFWVPTCLDNSLAVTSNGFCHQAVWIKTSLLRQYPFRDGSGLIDSDRVQLISILYAGHTLAKINAVVCERSANIGLSAGSWGKEVDILSKEFDYARTQAVKWNVSLVDLADLINFHRYSTPVLVEKMYSLLENALITCEGRRAIVLAILESLFRPSSRKIGNEQIKLLAEKCIAVLDSTGNKDAITSFMSAKYRHIAISRQEMVIQRTKAKNHIKFLQYLEAVCSIKNLKNVGPSRESLLIEPVIALTTFPARISTLSYVIESLICQTIKPKHIYLSVGRDEFGAVTSLPEKIRDLAALEKITIIFADKTLNQYDKYCHLPQTIRESEYICIVDDDVIYQPNVIEDLVRSVYNNPGVIAANRAHLMRVQQNGSVAEYSTWLKELYTNRIMHLLCPTGVGGVMYPPGFLTGDACDKRSIAEHAPYADDLWLKYISRVRGIPVACAAPPGKGNKSHNNWLTRYIPSMHETSLYSVNDLMGLNTLQIDKLDKKFGFPFKNDH